MNSIIGRVAMIRVWFSEQLGKTGDDTSDAFPVGMFLAPRARHPISSLGQRPRTFGNQDASAESAIHFPRTENLD
jgi:hypothetical protein